MIKQVYVLLLVVGLRLVSATTDPRYKACVKQCTRDKAICQRFIDQSAPIEIQREKEVQCMVYYYNCMSKCRPYCPYSTFRRV
ncbi:hypothetical protein LSAT2_001745 [Lamellibrachia satsuma]|nr:hypothetical protein LSAT2_001745 [Lamellibrachia satsuma]